MNNLCRILFSNSLVLKELAGLGTSHKFGSLVWLKSLVMAKDFLMPVCCFVVYRCSLKSNRLINVYKGSLL